jgi:hypothetical protein
MQIPQRSICTGYLQRSPTKDNSMPKGYEKRDIAIAQLRKAIQLFNAKEYVCAVTLAGAAEEILGKIAKKRGGTTALEGETHFWNQLAEIVNKPKPERKKVIDVLNRARNELKHNDSGKNIFYEADFEFEAQCLIDRAIRNYWLAYDTPLRDRIVDNYVRFHWN